MQSVQSGKSFQKAHCGLMEGFALNPKRIGDFEFGADKGRKISFRRRPLVGWLGIRAGFSIPA